MRDSEIHISTAKTNFTVHLSADILYSIQRLVARNSIILSFARPRKQADIWTPLYSEEFFSRLILALYTLLVYRFVPRGTGDLTSPLKKKKNPSIPLLLFTQVPSEINSVNLYI